ncbi:MAG: exodeoxyribonuclease VII small subunit [Saprospiraceae bacterium]
MDNQPTYEQAMQELEAILQTLQQPQVKLDDLVANNQRAMELIRYCRAKLKDMEATLAEAEDTPSL